MHVLGRHRPVSCSDVRRDLSAFIDRRLDSETRTAFNRHISACPECERELITLEATVSLLRRLPEEAPLQPFSVAATLPVHGRRAVVWLGMATAAVSLLLVLAFSADITNVFQTRQQVQEEPYDVIGQRSTSGLPGTDESDEVSAESGWVRPSVYGLLGATAVLGGATYVLWRRGRRLAAAPTRR